MNIPVFIEPSSNGGGFSASLGAPFNATIEAPTRNELGEKFAALIRQYVERGGELLWIRIPEPPQSLPPPGWLPDDDLTREWLRAIEEYRDKCDKEDLERIADEDAARAS